MPEVQADELLENYTFYLSMADIALLDEVAKSELDKKSLIKICYENGLDTKRSYQFVYDTHRALTGSVVKTQRVVGYMRKDSEWKKKFGTDINETIKDLTTQRKYVGSDDFV